jgi:hypothetical protein
VEWSSQHVWSQGPCLSNRHGSALDSMTMELRSLRTQISSLLEATLTAVDDPAVPVSALARKALRIARLRNDWEAEWWLRMEMTTVTDDLSSPLPDVKRISADVAPHLTTDEYNAMGNRVFEKWMHGARSVEKDKFCPTGIADTEARVEGLASQIGAIKIPDGLHPVDLYHRSNELTNAAVQLNALLMQSRGVLARQRNAIGDYLSEVERQVVFGNVNADVFERNRKYVDERLATIAPQALEQFAAAYRRQDEGDAEARSHALTSCRRVLKTLADALYPATNETVEGVDGARRRMTEDRHISRLCQFVADRPAGSASRKLLERQVKTLGERLDALNALSSKGVHDEVSSAEVDQCLIQTYTTVGDLLRIAEDRSAIVST